MKRRSKKKVRKDKTMVDGRSWEKKGCFVDI